MTSLLKATLQELPATEGAPPIGEPVNVQFNPTTLRVQISNRSAGGQQAGSQARQRPGTGEMAVSFDLIFDTADEGTTDAPVPVTRKTMIVEKFVRPRGSAPNEQTPPRVEFKWGTFVVQGVMESANIDLDLFAANGTPLRAKVSVSIKGQNPEYRYDPVLPAAGANSGNTAAPPRSPNRPAAGSPGTVGGADNPSQVSQAMPGESLQQLAARNGLDPAAWRALAEGIKNPQALLAGEEIPLPSSLNQGAGLGGNSGRDAQSITSQLPLLSNDTTAKSASGNAVTQGQALSQLGGVQGSIRHLAGTQQRQALLASQSGFGLTQQAATTANQSAANQSAHYEPRPYGRNAPLRPQRPTDQAAPATADPTVPQWQALPNRTTTQAPGGKRSSGCCGCVTPNKSQRGH